MRLLSSRSDAVTMGLFVVTGALITVGLIMLASSSASLDGSLGDSLTWNSRLGRQAMIAPIALILLLLLSRIDTGVLRWRRGGWIQPAVIVFVLALGAVAAVWLQDFGVESHGRRRWISLGSFNFQPSDVAKIVMVVYLAALLTRKKPADSRPGTVGAVVGIGALCALIGLEDFGTAALLAGVGFLMMLAAGCRWLSLLAWSVPGIGAFVYLLFSESYRLERLMAFRDVWSDPKGVGYHAIQSLAAISSGGWAGRGLGNGVAKFGYLPERQTDFIFALICEETGVLGATVVILMYVALICIGLRIMAIVPNDDGGFRRLFAFGVTTTIGLQALMNIAVVTVVAPTKGIGLPFVSAGGSSLLCFSVAVGMLAGTARTADRRARTVPAEGPVPTPIAGVEVAT